MMFVSTAGGFCDETKDAPEPVSHLQVTSKVKETPTKKKKKVSRECYNSYNLSLDQPEGCNRKSGVKYPDTLLAEDAKLQE